MHALLRLSISFKLLLPESFSEASESLPFPSAQQKNTKWRKKTFCHLQKGPKQPRSQHTYTIDTKAHTNAHEHTPKKGTQRDSETLYVWDNLSSEPHHNKYIFKMYSNLRVKERKYPGWQKNHFIYQHPEHLNLI